MAEEARLIVVIQDAGGGSAGTPGAPSPTPAPPAVGPALPPVPPAGQPPAPPTPGLNFPAPTPALPPGATAAGTPRPAPPAFPNIQAPNLSQFLKPLPVTIVSPLPLPVLVVPGTPGAGGHGPGANPLLGGNDPTGRVLHRLLFAATTGGDIGSVAQGVLQVGLNWLGVMHPATIAFAALNTGVNTVIKAMQVAAAETRAFGEAQAAFARNDVLAADAAQRRAEIARLSMADNVPVLNWFTGIAKAAQQQEIARLEAVKAEREAMLGHLGEISGFSPQLAGAFALQNVANIQMRLREAMENGDELASYVEGQTKRMRLEYAISEEVRKLIAKRQPDTDYYLERGVEVAERQLLANLASQDSAQAMLDFFTGQYKKDIEEIRKKVKAIADGADDVADTQLFWKDLRDAADAADRQATRDARDNPHAKERRGAPRAIRFAPE